MFFIITHTWEAEHDEAVNKTFIAFYRLAHNGKLGDPWPKLFYSWRKPQSRTMFSLMEASSPESLDELLAKIENVKSTKERVFQLYPAYVDTFSFLDINQDPVWKKIADTTLSAEPEKP